MNDWTSDSEPRLQRIVATTVGAPDLGAAERSYVGHLGYRVIDRHSLDPALAASWGVPDSAGARTLTLVAEGEEDTFVRLIERPALPGYQPLTTYGWNAFEIIVDDVHALHQQLIDSPFRIIGPPKPLQFMPSIVAMQVVGPGQECLYFTMECGDRETSILPPPGGFIGRTFIVVCAGPDFTKLLRWYVDQFALRERPVREGKVAIVQQAQGLDADHTMALSAIGMVQRGNLIELDGYPSGPGYVARPRPGAPGMLPPGNALVTLEVDDLAAYAPAALRPPHRRTEAPYLGRESCTLVGPAGELLELVQAG